MEAIPSQAGTFTIEASVIWRMGNKRGAATRAVEVAVVEAAIAPSSQHSGIGGEVSSSPSPSPTSAPAPLSQPVPTPTSEPDTTSIDTDEVVRWIKENAPEVIVGLIGGSVLLIIVVNVLSNFITDLLKGIGAATLRMFKRR